MLEKYEDQINVDTLMEIVRKKVTEKRDLAEEFVPHKLKEGGRYKLILGQVKKLLKAAEIRSVARNKWPDRLNRFPWNISIIFKPFVLKALSLLFKDQREVNDNLIAALKLSLIVNENLVEERENLWLEIEKLYSQVKKFEVDKEDKSQEKNE